jgi:hypothetical protein
MGLKHTKHVAFEMITIGIKNNISDTIKLLDNQHRKQVPFAIAKALTKTAQLGQAAVQNEMKAQFDRPTPYTLKSLFVKPATKQKLQAAVYLKGDPPGGGNPNSLAKILGHQYGGGTRIRKRLEQALTRAGLISEGEFVSPGAAAKLDQYGNMSRGQIQQVMSQIRIGIDPYAYSSKSKRSMASVKKSGGLFWSRGGKLSRGVWMRDGLSVKPILLVIATPRYKRRINLDSVVKRIVDTRFDSEFKKALADAVRTAR